MRKEYCDLCKKEISETKKIEITNNNMFNYGGREFYDICLECKIKIIDFINSITK